MGKRNKVLVSIIVPAYNAEKFILECLDSCFVQKLEHDGGVEVIVVDDGSTDSTEELLAPLASDNKIKYIKQRNMGGSLARNAGIDAAQGEFLYFLDADDVLSPGAISKMIKAINSGGYDICVGNYIEIDECGRKKSDAGIFKSRITYKNFNSLVYLFSIYPNPSTKLYRADIVRRNNLYFRKLPIAQDLDFYFKYLFCCDNAVAIADDVYQYRITNGSVSRSYDKRVVGIVDAFNDVASFADGLGMGHEYTTHLQNVELMHICYQIDKLKFVESRNDRESIYSELISRARKLAVNKNSPTYKNAKKNIVRLKVYQLFGYSKATRMLAKLVGAVLV